MTNQSDAVPMQPRTYKRKIRNLIIHKPLQREYLFVVIALLLVSTLAIGFVIHATIRDAAFGGGFRFGKISPYEILSDVSYDLVTRVSLILFLTLIVIAVFGVSFLHRVAGPVYRFRQVFMKLNNNEIPRKIKLREGDFFNETADEINGVLDRIEMSRESLETLRREITEILAGSVVSPEAAEKLNNMKKMIDSNL